jgi:signal transduction histidine kinase
MNDNDDSRTRSDEQEFVLMLVHELRTPLTALRGSLGLLAVAVEEATPEVRSFAAIADRNAGRVASMLDEVAEYWQLNDPTTPLNYEPTDVADTVQRAIEQVQALIDERGVVLDVQTTPSDATVDPLLVRRAVVRLLFYALSASPKKATLHVRVDTVDPTGAADRQPASKRQRRRKGDAEVGAGVSGHSLSSEGQGPLGPSVVVSVTDGGRVVAPENAARMFEPFSAVARRGPESAMRTGLCLAIAQRVAVRHGGSLAFTSTEEGGRFELHLPVEVVSSR